MSATDQLDPTIFFIFGGAGDLTWRKLIPAMFDLSHDRSMPCNFSIIGVDRVAYTDEEYRNHLRQGVDQFSRQGKAKDKTWNWFSQNIFYKQGDFFKPETYQNLCNRCESLEKEWNSKAHKVFYMATPPSMFGEIPKRLSEAGLADNRGLSRIVIEKPIGYDLNSAKNLDETLTKSFQESQIFRIDHYLGKETVQNILAFRFANPLFEPIWNRRFVEYITITVAEDIGIAHRGGYFDKAGELRDMVQNHLMQLLCLVAMEPMVSFNADKIRDKKIDVLDAVRPFSHDDVGKYVIRGQYGRGKVNGEEVAAYREEPGVSSGSNTETFVAMKLFVDNWRWQDVPFYLRTGKRLATRSSEIVIQFRAVPHQSFPPEASQDWQPSRLTISIQPDEGIMLRFQAKQPGPKVLLKPVDMRFSYRESFSGPFPDAYETLLWDIMKNDATLFMRADQVEAAWRILMPILEVWENETPKDFPNYSAGSWGPQAMYELLSKEGHNWPDTPKLFQEEPSLANTH